MVDIQTFKMNVKKGSYYDIDAVQGSIENLMKHKIEDYIDKRPNCYIVSVDMEWYEEEEDFILVATLTYKITSDVIDECPCF